jgi:replicative DNA helicase
VIKKIKINKMNIESFTNDELDRFLNAGDKIVLLKDIPFLEGTEKYSLGFKVFDDALANGVKDGDLVVISGRSGEGKTTFAQTLTYNFCRRGVPCLWFSYEVSLKELDRKFREMGILDFYEVAVPEKNSSGKIEWLKEKIKESWAKFNTKIIFIDHIDFLIPNTSRTSDNEQSSLKRITTELKQLAIDLGIVIITMAHIRKIEEGKEPGLHDIGYSAGVFQLADLVFMVFREKISSAGLENRGVSGDIFTNYTFVKILKNRETGVLKFLKLQYANGKFFEIDTRPAVRDFADPMFGQTD